MTFAMLEFLGLYLLAASMQPHRGVLLGGWRSIATPRATVIAGWLLVPYLCWVLYASTINAGVVALN